MKKKKEEIKIPAFWFSCTLKCKRKKNFKVHLLTCKTGNICPQLATLL